MEGDEILRAATSDEGVLIDQLQRQCSFVDMHVETSGSGVLTVTRAGVAVEHTCAVHMH